MIHIDALKDPNWVQDATFAVQLEGFCLVENVLDAALIESVRKAMYETQEKILDHVGIDRLKRAGELGVLRLMMKFDPIFFRLLEIDPLLSLVDAMLDSTAILHLQNGFILPSSPRGQDHIFQNSFHRDFPRILNRYFGSINTFLALDDFTEDNGATVVVPGTHQKTNVPSEAYCRRNSVKALGPAGSMLLFDSTLLHAAGQNTSGRDRLAINQQFTRSYFKQQLDYVRALSDETLSILPERTQQLLGWYTRVPTSLLEYYVPENQRLYRRGQG